MILTATKASDRVRALVCGIPRARREHRILVMLKAFIDDSEIGTAPVYILGGWVASVPQWETFSDDWDKVLRMSPRIRYFKYSDAMGFNGEFAGISKESRDEKMKLLVGVIEDCKLLGVVTILPDVIWKRYFAPAPERDIRIPYFPMVFSLIGRLVEHHYANGVTEPTEFVFDDQPGKTEYVIDAWRQFRRNAPPQVVPLISPNLPSFQSDEDVVALQAADLIAGWSRQQQKWFATDKTDLPAMPWGEKGKSVKCIRRFWTDDFARQVFKELEEARATSFSDPRFSA